MIQLRQITLSKLPLARTVLGSSVYSPVWLTGFEVMDSTLDCGTRGKTKGCGSLSTQGLCEADLVIAILLSSSEQRNRIYYPWISPDPQYCEKKNLPSDLVVSG